MTIASFILFIFQLTLGTSVIFSTEVFTALLLTFATLRIIGLFTITGIFVFACVFRFLLFSQFMKTVYGQAGDSNLLAPETTITVISLGTITMCASAILVSLILRNTQIIKEGNKLDTLPKIRNISIILGSIFPLIIILGGTDTDTGEMARGGIVGWAHQFANIGYLAILAETFHVLNKSQGRRSISLYLLAAMGLLMAFGIADARKATIAQCLMSYFIACICIRKSITKQQIMATVLLATFGVTIVYPIINLSRSTIGITGSRLTSVLEIIDRVIDDPSELYTMWEIQNSRPVLELDRMTQGLFYLGFDDALLERGLLIANTDVVASAVDEDGVFGIGGITDGFKLLLPTFLSPNKPKFSHGDQVTWYYGLRPYDLVGYPTLGFFGSCYATLGMFGVFLLTFCILFPMFFLLQISGRKIQQGNMLGIYLLVSNIPDFGEMGIDAAIIKVLRNIPLDIASVIIIFYVANLLSIHRPPGKHISAKIIPILEK